MKEKDKYEWGDGVFSLLSWYQKDTVRNARILVAGAGALGNEVIKNLALFGIGHIFIIDYDHIELSNLTRSVLFREEDAECHAYKAEVAARRAKEINPQIEAVPIIGHLASDAGLGLYRSVDVIIGCLDSLLARYQLNRLAFKAGKPWIDGSIENLTGTVKVYHPGRSCFECELSKNEFSNLMVKTGCADVLRLHESSARVATTPVSASIIGAVQVQEAVKIIHSGTKADSSETKTLEGILFRYDGMNNLFNLFRRSIYKSGCPAHDVWTDIIEAKNLSAKDSLTSVFSKLSQLLHTDAEHLEINLLNNKFIDSITSDHHQKKFLLRIPESRLTNYISSHQNIKRLCEITTFKKCYFENIDKNFPFMEMTLEDIGIPLFDIIEVTTGDKTFHIELSGDSHNF